MYPVLPPRACLEALADLDHRLAEALRAKGCPHCDGPLHSANWRRNPRGADVPDEMTIRRGLCCGHCRQRSLPESVLFHGRRVYLKAVVLMTVASRQPDRVKATVQRLAELFGVARQTVRRWLLAYLEGLSEHPAWRRVRGQVPPTVRDGDVPAVLLDVLLLRQDLASTLRTVCRWVPPL